MHSRPYRADRPPSPFHADADLVDIALEGRHDAYPLRQFDQSKSERHEGIRPLVISGRFMTDHRTGPHGSPTTERLLRELRTPQFEQVFRLPNAISPQASHWLPSRRTCSADVNGAVNKPSLISVRFFSLAD